MQKFPVDLVNADLIQHGAGQCETCADDKCIELTLERGTLVLWPEGEWEWIGASQTANEKENGDKA